ncbi:MAG: winged helix-turn-helix transcriptional regulator [Pararhodobacter sp.]|nr:winged helix-turn-helix transcriptional regulator [Pararhodobacter sp.]
MQPENDHASLVKQIRRLVRALDMQSRRIDRQVGLTMPQLIVLGALGRLGEVTSRALAAEVDLSPPTVAGILDKLEAKGLIRRYRSERDRRIVHARLTEAGRLALARAPDPLGAQLGGGFRALPEPQRRAILQGLALLGELAAADARQEVAAAPAPSPSPRQSAAVTGTRGLS